MIESPTHAMEPCPNGYVPFPDMMDEFVKAVKEYSHPSCPVSVLWVHRYYLIARYLQTEGHVVRCFNEKEITYMGPDDDKGVPWYVTTNWKEFETFVIVSSPINTMGFLEE